MTKTKIAKARGQTGAASREPDRIRKCILNAARKEFSGKGFAGARVEGIAARAGVSKQLVVHHFKTKERLYLEVHETLSQPSLQWDDHLPDDPAELMAERFRKRIPNLEYVRLLTWEAAGVRDQPLPGEAERKEQITRFGKIIRLMQEAKRLPHDMDYRMLHLAIVALASYPLAFSEATRMITGHGGTDPKFQKDWTKFLNQLGTILLDVAKKE